MLVLDAHWQKVNKSHSCATSQCLGRAGFMLHLVLSWFREQGQSFPNRLPVRSMGSCYDPSHQKDSFTFHFNNEEVLGIALTFLVSRMLCFLTIICHILFYKIIDRLCFRQSGVYFKADFSNGEAVSKGWCNWKLLGWQQQMAASGTVRRAYGLEFAGLISCQMGKILTMTKSHFPFIPEMPHNTLFIVTRGRKLENTV